MLYQLFPIINQFQLKNGALNVGGYLRVFFAGRTDVIAPTYNDPDGMSQNPEWIELDNNARAEVYANPDYAYNLFVYDNYKNLLWTQYNMLPESVVVDSVSKTYVDNQDNAIKAVLNSTAYDLQMQINQKQDRLTPGDHIDISVNEDDETVISVVGEFGKVYEGVAPVQVDNDNDEISVDHVELNVQNPITWDSTTHTIGFNDTGFAKSTDIPTDFYTKSQIDGKVDTINGSIGSVANRTTTLEGNYTTLEGRVSTNESAITTINGKFDNYYNKTQIDGFLSNWSGFVVIPLGQSLPAASEAQLGKIYLWKKADAQEKDNYEEWISDGTAWSKIGSMEVDLSNYYTKTETDGKYATITDYVGVNNAIRSLEENKLSTVVTDGVTITGNGTTNSPLVAHGGVDTTWTLETENGLTIRDDADHNKTYVGLTTTVTETINSLGNQVQGLTTGLASKQDALTPGSNITISEDNVISASMAPAVVSLKKLTWDSDNEVWSTTISTPNEFKSKVLYMIRVDDFSGTTWGIKINGSNWQTGIVGAQLWTGCCTGNTGMTSITIAVTGLSSGAHAPTMQYMIW